MKENNVFARGAAKIYDLRVKLHQKFPRKKKEATIKNSKRAQLAFYCFLIAIPIVQFAIFYVGVNFNSILLAFRKYDVAGGEYAWAGLANFRRAFDSLKNLPDLHYALGNSLIVYACSLVIGTSLALLFSYYIFRKFAGYKFFKVILFMPSIISSMVMSVIFSTFANRVVPFISATYFGKEIEGLLSNVNTLLPTMIAYTIFIGFGANILLYVGAMANISESVIESAQLDGAGNLRLLWSIVIPMIFPTMSTFIVVGLTGIFTNQISLFAFFSDSADTRVYTYGYYLYVKTVTSTTIEYPYLAALGLIFTCIAAPLTIIVRKLLNKFGPSAD